MRAQAIPGKAYDEYHRKGCGPRFCALEVAGKQAPRRGLWKAIFRISFKPLLVTNIKVSLKPRRESKHQYMAGSVAT
jgi:hypothetical protein